MLEPIGKERAKRIGKLATAKGREAEGLLLLDSPALIARAFALDLLVEVIVDEERARVANAKPRADVSESSASAPDGSRRPDDPDEFFALIRRMAAAGVRVTPARADSLRRIADVETPAGAVAVARRPASASWGDLTARASCRGVFLDGIADPGNLGGIARSAAAFGCDFLLLSDGCADPQAPKSLRASAGALLTLPVLRGDLTHSEIRDAQFQVLRTLPCGGEDCDAIDYGARTILWLGNEARGVGAAPPGIAVRDVSIAMAGETESLNVASAAAVFLHALARHRPARANPAKP